MSQENTRRDSGYLLLAMGTILFWSSAFTLTKIALEDFSVGALGFLRYLISSVFLLVIFLAKKQSLPEKKDLPGLFLTGLIGFSIYMIAFNKAQETLTSATGSIVIATVPIMTSILALLIYKEKMRKLAWLAIAIEFSGIIILTLWNGVFSINIGVLWMFTAAICISVYNLMQRKYTLKYNSLQATTLSIWGGTIFLGVFAKPAFTEMLEASTTSLLSVVLLAIFPSALGFLMWTKALARAGRTASVTNFMFVTPLLATLIGFSLIGEIPDLGTIVGGTVILSGVLLFNIINSRK